MNIGGEHNDLLVRLLDVAGLRHRTLAQNVANVNSPGYRRLDVRFEELIDQSLARGDVAGALHAREQVIEAGGGAERADGNNVDIDLEMGQLSKNTVLYRTFAQILGARLAMMRSAITGR